MKHLLGLLRSRQAVDGLTVAIADSIYHRFAVSDDVSFSHDDMQKYLKIEITPQLFAGKMRFLEQCKFISYSRKGKDFIVQRGENFITICRGGVVEELKEEKPEVREKVTKDSFRKRKLDFTMESMKYQNKYERAMIQDFVSYWAEKNTKKDTMRWEDHGHFDIGRRLATWYSRNKNKYSEPSW